MAINTVYFSYNIFAVAIATTYLSGYHCLWFLLWLNGEPFINTCMYYAQTLRKPLFWRSFLIYFKFCMELSYHGAKRSVLAVKSKYRNIVCVFSNMHSLETLRWLWFYNENVTLLKLINWAHLLYWRWWWIILRSWGVMQRSPLSRNFLLWLIVNHSSLKHCCTKWKLPSFLAKLFWIYRLSYISLKQFSQT